MRTIGNKDKHELESQVIAKMFREDKRFRTRVIPNKKKEYRSENWNCMGEKTQGWKRR